MSDLESERFYARAAKHHKSGPKAVGWRTRHAQSVRFRALDNALNLDGARVLDVGCGLGALCSYMDKDRRAMDYVGIDTVPAMITEARVLHPKRQFHLTSLEDCDFPAESFDVVLASGTFSRLGQCDTDYVVRFATQMFELGSRAVAFNSLSSVFSANENKGFSLDPTEALAPLLKISPWLEMVHTPDTGDVMFVLRRVQS